MEGGPQRSTQRAVTPSRLVVAETPARMPGGRGRTGTVWRTTGPAAPKGLSRCLVVWSEIPRRRQDETISTKRDSRDQDMKSSLFPLGKVGLREAQGPGQGMQVAGPALTSSVVLTCSVLSTTGTAAFAPHLLFPVRNQGPEGFVEC